MRTRSALYHTPPRHSPLGRFGVAWLGRDHYLGRAVEPLRTRVLTREQHTQATASPCRYGFHATLKAPFGLAAGRGECEPCDALADFVKARAAVTIPGLFLAILGGFVALVPAQVPPGLAELARASVTLFDRETPFTLVRLFPLQGAAG